MSSCAIQRSNSMALTLILELWGMAAPPLTAGRVISKTPKLFFVISWEFLSQLS